MNETTKSAAAAIKGEEHWITKDGGVKLFLFEKCAGDPAKTAAHHPVRPWLIDGRAADFRPSGRRAGRILR